MPRFTHKSLIFTGFFAGTLLLSGGMLLNQQNRSLPSQKKIDVPFVSQAPVGDWSEPWKNACEETSIYMVSSFYQDDEIKRDAAIQRIKEIFAVKNTEFAVSEDESLETIAALIQTLHLPWKAHLVRDPTQDALKAELAQNRPIIVPVFAPALWSANFKGGGPDYHVLVLIGYDDTKKEFIVNDPGTAEGRGLRFPYETFMKAIHDLNQQNYTAGQKAVLFTEPLDLPHWMSRLPLRDRVRLPGAAILR
jgi:hypothetical protein